MIEELEGCELFDKFIDQENLWNLEGESGLGSLNKICDSIGYKESGYKYGTSLETFLLDNPGCNEVILEWIKDHMDNCNEWEDSVARLINTDDEELEDEC